MKEIDHIAYSFDPAIHRIEVYLRLDDLYLSSIRRAPNLLAATGCWAKLELVDERFSARKNAWCLFLTQDPRLTPNFECCDESLDSVYS